jgi:hypothetical protein
MIGHGKGLTGSIVKLLESELFFDSDPALLSKDAVDVDGAIYGCDPVFRKEYDLDILGFEKLNQVSHNAIDFA